MLKVINHKYKAFTRYRTQHYRRLKFWVTSKRELHRELSKGQAKVYATSTEAGSVGAGVLDEGTKAEGVEAGGVGAGRIRYTSLGAYSFAFLKNSFISAGGRA
jgi:hypothetical protein